MRPIVFGLLVLIALGAFAWTVTRYVRFMLRGRRVGAGFRSWGARFVDVLVYFLFQKSVAREWASRHHLLIFWGFLIITVGSLELIIRGLQPSFSFSYGVLLGHWFDNLFHLILDLTNAVVLVVMLWAFFRRTVLKPRLIPLSLDATLILGMIALLCVTHFLMHGAAAVASGATHAGMPVSAATASLLRGLSPETAAAVSMGNWWVHMIIILFFLNYIPYSKHIHLLGALPNIALRNRGQKGILPRLDLEDETQWGVASYDRFDWKSLLDSYACTECARCSVNCPAFATDKPLSPMHLIHDIRDEMRQKGGKLIRLTRGVDPARIDEAPAAGAGNGAPGPTDADRALSKELAALPAMVGGRIKDETLWACVTCGACEATCPVFIEHPLKIVQMRTHLVLAESRIPAELARMYRGLENNQNPWGLGSDKRMEWAEGLELPVLSEKGSAEYLAWIGCAGCYDDRGKKIARAWVQLLQRAGVDFAILGLEEGCTGDHARRSGNEFLFQTLAEANIELFKGYGVKKILVICPHCYHSFKNEYPQLGGHYEVWHHSQFIQKLLAEGKLQPTVTPLEGGTTYHDSCYLGRWNEVYDPPRQVLAAATGRPPLEMPRHGYKGFCCGAGGGRMWMEEAAPRINENRTREALATGARNIATACPFCMVMITDGVKAANREEEVRVLDLAEVVLASLPPLPAVPAPPTSASTEPAPPSPAS